MQKLKPNLTTILIALYTAVPSTSGAEGRFTVATGLGYGSEFYEGEESNTGVGLNLAYETEFYHLGLDGFSYNVVRNEAFQVSVGLAPRLKPDFPDGALFSGLDRDNTVEGTLRATYRFSDVVGASLNLRHDLLSQHDGYELELAMGRTVAVGAATLALSVGARHRDADLNTYLVGVSASEATGSRPSYSPGSTTSPFAGVSFTLPVASQLALIGNMGLEYFGDAYSDSPLVKRDYATSVGVGLAYSF